MEDRYLPKKVNVKDLVEELVRQFQNDGERTSEYLDKKIEFFITQLDVPQSKPLDQKPNPREPDPTN